VIKTIQEIKMQIKSLWKSCALVIMACLCLQSVTAVAGQSDPVALLQSIANNMIQGLKANKATLKTKPGIVYSLANRYVVPYADLNEMSRRVLPPQTWNSATAAQRAQFKRDFTTLLIRTYASALTSYQDQEIQFYPIRGGYQGVNNVEVSSDISGSNSSTIHVTYRLLRSGGSWRLYDMSVEGVGLIDSFRSQFADILSQGDMNLLLKRMGRHNDGDDN
jgi:phospholipid transport system substrate-binding protein